MFVCRYVCMWIYLYVYFVCIFCMYMFILGFLDKKKGLGFWAVEDE